MGCLFFLQGTCPKLGIASESPALAGGFFTTVEFSVDHHEQSDQLCQPVLRDCVNDGRKRAAELMLLQYKVIMS